MLVLNHFCKIIRCQPKQLQQCQNQRSVCLQDAGFTCMLLAPSKEQGRAAEAPLDWGGGRETDCRLLILLAMVGLSLLLICGRSRQSFTHHQASQLQHHPILFLN